MRTKPKKRILRRCGTCGLFARECGALGCCHLVPGIPVDRHAKSGPFDCWVSISRRVAQKRRGPVE